MPHPTREPADLGPDGALRRARFPAHGRGRPAGDERAGDRGPRRRNPRRALRHPLAEAFAADPSPSGWSQLPAVAGAIQSLVGPGPDRRPPRRAHPRAPRGHAQPLHGDAIIDVRPDAFDVQLMYYPQEVTADMGGTLSVPGSHLRRTNETDTGRYQNLRGQTRLICPAGTVRPPPPRHLARRPAQRQRHPPLHVQDPLQPHGPPGPAVEHRRPGRPAVARRTRPASPGTSPPPAGWRSTTGSCCGGPSPATTPSTSTTGSPGSDRPQRVVTQRSLNPHAAEGDGMTATASDSRR